MKIKLSILFLLSSLFVFANTGTIKGIIKDKDNKEHLMGVSIAIYNKEKTEMITGTITDMDGNYEIDLEPGDYHFEISYVSYKNEDLRIAIKPEETIIKNIELMETSFDLESVEIIARVSRESENLLLLDQKEATSIEEKIGAKELSRKGSSNVAAGVKKIAGVSMMGSKQLFVRGLGDRYNSVELNGLPLVSPDPTKKIIKLDMFSSNIIEYLNVQKAYSANHFADYTGALININTLDYPEEALLKFSMGSSFNNQSTGKDFTRINAEGLRYFSFDVKKRQELTPQKYWVAKKRTQEIDADFNYASYGFSKNKAMPTSDFSLTGGKLFKLKNQRKLGFLIHLSHKNKYEYKPNVIQKQINKQNIIDADFISQKYSYNSVFTSFLNLAFIPNKNNSLKYNILFLNNGEDGFNEKVGTRPDWQNGEKIATIRNAQYINYRLFVQQLKGEHQLSKPLSLHWALGLTDVKYDVPDRREIVYINPTSENKNEWVYMTLNNGNDSKRVIVNQLNKELNFNIFFKYELGKKETKGSIKVGAAGKSTTTNYHSYYYGYLFETQEGNLTLPVDIQNPDEYFTPEYLKKVRNNSSDAMGYIGESYIWAGFADFNYHFGEKITLNAGLRTEISQMSVTADMNVDDGDEKASTYKDFDLFPALNIKYAPQENMNIKLAASRTITRPSFYEKSPAYIIPEQGARQIIGNPYTKENPSNDGSYLENSHSNNIEIKWEYFPNMGEIISLGAYGKIINEPIERVSKLKGGTDITYTYQNFQDKGYATGVEFVFRKKLGSLFTGFNAAYIYTLVKTSKTNNENAEKRSLQGASPYLINADLGYELKYGKDKKYRSYISLVYNVFGKRLFSVGISGAGNQYEMPINTLDFILKNKISKKWSFDIYAKNILNAKHTIKQDVYENMQSPNEITNHIVTYQFQEGINIGFKIKYSL